MPELPQAAGPTPAVLRRLLKDRLRTAADFDAFCLDCFPDIYGRFSASLTRTERTNLLFELVADPLLIEQELKKYLDVADHARPIASAVLPAPLAAPPAAPDFGAQMGEITVRLERIEAPPQVPRAPLPGLTTGQGGSVAAPPSWRSKRLLILGLASALVTLSLTSALWLALHRTQSARSADRGPQVQAPTGPPNPAPAPVSPTEELAMVTSELLRQADQEHKIGGALGLFTSLSTVEALHHVADIFIKKPTVVTALVVSKLLDHQRALGKSTADVDARLAQVLAVAAGVPAKSAERRGISAALTSDLHSLGLALQDPNREVVMTATQRLVWSRLSSAMVKEALRDLYNAGGLEQILAYGLLRQLGTEVKPPAGILDALMHAEADRRCLVVAAIGQWPSGDARPILVRVVEQDQTPFVRRQALDSAIEITRRESLFKPKSRSPERTSTGSVLDDLLARAASDPDDGVRLRRKYILARRRVPEPPPPSRLDWTTGGSVATTFTGESRVTFSVDSTPYQVPVKLQLPPGPYWLSYPCKTGVHRELLIIPRGPTFTKVIPVSLSEQRLRLVK